MPWHPPIPFGALYTEDAIRLGEALSLLGYCYDCVDRSGWAHISLRQAAGDMCVSYATVKRWWDKLQKTDYIAEYHDHRRGGLEIRMADTWLDWWREERYEKGAEVSPFQQTKGINSEPIGGEIVQKSSRNRPEKGAEVSPNSSAYKVLMIPDQAESHGGSEDQDGTRRTHPPAVATLFEIFPEATISVEQTDDLCSISNLALWREVLTTWKANGYKPRIGNLLDRYRKDAAKEQHHATQGHRNGRKQYTPPSPEWAGWTEVDTDKPL